ncbi:hypothetical protein KUL72_23765 [Bradyrhizobium arachidis]|uniref:hypothetical protein n=1 Tax=Bradyrhizobium arachidis TaxID=858423 RepID=UPI00216358D7|nr:hypothetical protein [Bradyrhizobium arachidis]UVO34498.1 hypothetical protein KUL72_23765 [Bradyrhizobium arachidis]
MCYLYSITTNQAVVINLFRVVIQQHQRSQCIAQVAVTIGNDLIDRHFVFIKERVGALAWHTNHIQTEI